MLTSITRTVVPILIGYVVQFLALLNVDLTEDQAKALGGLLTAIIAAVYYIVARALEQKFPWATVLLGSSKQPAAYSPDGTLTTPPVDEVVVDDEPGKHEAVDSAESIAADAATPAA